MRVSAVGADNMTHSRSHLTHNHRHAMVRPKPYPTLPYPTLVPTLPHPTLGHLSSSLFCLPLRSRSNDTHTHTHTHTHIYIYIHTYR